MTDVRKLICEMGCEDAVVFDNPDYDEAIIGVTEDGRVVYDYDQMAECLAEKDNIDILEAMEFIDYNTIRTIPYIKENAPVIMYPLIGEKNDKERY